MNTTPFYDLPQYTPTDTISYMGTFNTAMADIDTAIHQAQAKADSTESLANTANTNANSALNLTTDHESEISTLQTQSSANTNAINSINAQNVIRDNKINGLVALTGSQSIAGIGDGTVTGALVELYESNVGVQYSLNEQVIGRWVDNKPVYRKTINFGALPNANYKNVAHGITNLKQVIKIDGVSTSATGVQMPLPTVNTSQMNYSVSLQLDSTSINIITQIDRSEYSSTYVTIEYTKTTD